MAAKPPPTRPHIGLHSSFNARANTDWGEDDVWDSGSDSESPRQSTISNSWRLTSPSYRHQPSQVTAPKPVPRASSNSSSSNLSFSYTHLNAPSSYPSNSDTSLPAKGGWTMVRKSSTLQDTSGGKISKENDPSGDADVDGDMVVGDFEPEMEQTTSARTKTKPDQSSIKPDAIELVNGADIYSESLCISKRTSRSIS